MTKTTKPRRLGSLSVSLAFTGVLSLASPGLSAGSVTEGAERPTATSPSEDETFSDAVIVTAQKREEDLLDVPVSVALISDETLEREQRVEYRDLQYLLPGVTQHASGGMTWSLIVRGVGTASHSDGVEGSVGIAIDGVVLGREAMGVLDLIDIERVELLRGPQGTLFGKNSSAGLLNIVTASPSSDFRLKLGAGVASRNERRVLASVGGSGGSERFTSLVTAYSNRRDGIVSDINLERSYNGRDEYGGRGKLRFRANDRVSLAASVDAIELDEICCRVTSRVTNPTRFLGLLEPPVVPGPENREVNLSGGYDGDVENRGGALSVDALLGNLSLTSITAHRSWRPRIQSDLDGTPVDFLDTFGSERDQRQLSQEVRLSGLAGDAGEWVLGAYYFDQTIDTDSIAVGPFGSSTTFANAIFWSFDTQNSALFGNFDWSLTDRWTLFAGARVLEESLDYDYQLSPVGDMPLFPGNPERILRGELDDEALTFRLGTSVELTERSTAYAKIARGYKGGGFNAFNTTLVVDEVAPEIPTNFEIGYRARLARQRLSLGAVVFHTRFKDFQAETWDEINLVFDLNNAGRVETEGIELDLSYRPTSKLGLDFSATWLDATFQEFSEIRCYRGQTEALGCNPETGRQSLNGKTLANAPESSATVSAHYTSPLGSSPVEGFVHGSAYWRDSVSSAANLDPRTEIGSLTLVNLAFGVQSKSGRYRVSVYAKNLFEEHFVARINQSILSSAEVVQYPVPEALRSVGFTVDFEF